MEKYGEVPKKFTAAWFEYIWDYYKIHIIVGLIVLISVVYTWIAIATATYYDLNICIAGNNAFSEESKAQLTEALKNKVSDINGDGEINIQILDCSIPANFSDAEYANAMETKFQLELQAGDSFIFIVTKNKTEELLNNSAVNGLFENPEIWNGKKSDNIYFSKIEESSVLQNADILYDDLYVGIRNFTYSEGNEKDIAQRNNAITAAKSILGS